VRNEINIGGDYATIQLYNIKGENDGITMIDRDDVRLVENYKWFRSSGTYVSGNVEGKRILLHKFIMDTTDSIDHVNGDSLDNRRENLRTATQSQNMMNRKAMNGDLVGVMREGKRWCARIKKDGKRYYLGAYKTINEAIAARKAGEIILHGEYSVRNRK